MGKLTSCGLAYKLERIDKHPSPPAAWTVKGIALHEALEGWEKGERTEDPLVLFEEAWEKCLASMVVKQSDLSKWVKTPRVKLTETDLDLRHRDGLLEVERYTTRALAEADIWVPWRLEDGTVAVELKFEYDFGPETPFVIWGYIDILQYWLAEGVVTVGDYKSGRDSRENKRQLGLYRAAANKYYGANIDFGQYYYTKLDRSSGWLDLRHYTPEYLLEEYTMADKMIQQNLFLANPSKDGCKFCGVKQFCDEMKDYR